jgi:hypothetical protein
MSLYVGVMIGALFYLLAQLNSALKLQSFSWKYFFKDNTIPTLLNLIAGCYFVYNKEEMANIYPITKLTAFAMGLSGQVILKKVINALNPEKKTFVGTGGDNTGDNES